MTSGLRGLMERTLSGGRLEIVQGGIASKDTLETAEIAADLEADLEDQEAPR